MLEYSAWKWNPYYLDVKEFERIWHESATADEGLGIQGYRRRFGEDDDDAEQNSFGSDAKVWDNFHVIVSRSVEHMFEGV